MLSTPLLVVIYVSFLSLGLPDSVFGSAWPSMHGGLGVPVHYAGVLAIICSAGTVVSSTLSGRLASRFKPGIIAATSTLITACALAGFAFSQNFIMLCVCAIPLGLGAGAVDATLNNHVALNYKARHMNWLHCFWGVGASTGPLILAAELKAGNGWRDSYGVISVLQLCFAALLFCTLPLWNNRKGEPAEKPAPVRLAVLLPMPRLKPMLGVFFCYSTMEAVCGLWGSSFLVHARDFPVEKAALIISLFYLGITSGRFASGFLSMRLGNKTMVRLGLGTVLCGAVLLMMPQDMFAAPGFFLAGLGCAPIYPALLHETPRNFDPAYSQAIIGLQMASAYTGATLMSPLAGRIASRLGFGIFPAIPMLLVAVMSILFVCGTRRGKPVRPPVSRRA